MVHKDQAFSVYSRDARDSRTPHFLEAHKQAEFELSPTVPFHVCSFRAP